MSTKKTIQINPELFKVPGTKTKKNKEHKEKGLSINTLISPNKIKNKLLKRIKDHKTQEMKTKINNTSVDNVAQKTTNTSDEFYGALNYLSDLTKKQANETKQKQLNNTKTLKNYRPMNYSNMNNSTNNMNMNISLELPPELQETAVCNPTTPEIFRVNNHTQLDDVPYGCLKNGKKKTYREWKELTNPSIDIPDIVRPPTPPKKNITPFLEGATYIEEPIHKPQPQLQQLSRDQRLEHIKQKLKKLQEQELQTNAQLEKRYTEEDMSLMDDLHDTHTQDLTQMIKKREESKLEKNQHKYLKKTIRRKFTLGKSDKLRRVAVLIKDHQTKKNIINTQQKLKKTNITDVRKYLRQHGIIKVGSTCPPDILRKTFETARLTGDITNTNKDNIIHNFLSSDKD